MGTDLILLGSLGAVGPDAARLRAGTSLPPGCPVQTQGDQKKCDILMDLGLLHKEKRGQKCDHSHLKLIEHRYER